MRVLGGLYGPEPHKGLLNCYEGTNITKEKTLIDALIASYAGTGCNLASPKGVFQIPLSMGNRNPLFLWGFTVALRRAQKQMILAGEILLKR